MKPIKLIVKTKTQKYPIIIGSNILTRLLSEFQKHSIKFNKCLIIFDKKVPRHYVIKIKKLLKNKNLYTYFLNASEKNKNQRTINYILEFLLNNNFSRQDCLITVGGGITGDIGGFAASLFKRGLNFINIPTTLLSQVDSSIGGKTGVNTKYGKNLIGSFYQPKMVISDVSFLKSLPKRELICGYGEILKHALISNKKFFKFLDKNYSKVLRLKSPFIEKAIFESCKIKKGVVEKDEKEKDLRKILNFGHTFAHAYEATLGFSKKLNHGEAVLLGMYSALRFSLKCNFIGKKECDLIITHFQKSNLPFNLKNYFKYKQSSKILKFMLKDKKNNDDRINLILLKKIGTPIYNKVYTKKNLKLFFENELIN